MWNRSTLPVLISSWQIKRCLNRRLTYWKSDSYKCPVGSDSGPLVISLQWVAPMKADLQLHTAGRQFMERKLLAGLYQAELRCFSSEGSVRWNLWCIKGWQLNPCDCSSGLLVAAKDWSWWSRAQIREDQTETDHADARLAERQRTGSDDGAQAQHIHQGYSKLSERRVNTGCPWTMTAVAISSW